jgi:hypothetical protein
MSSRTLRLATYLYRMAALADRINLLSKKYPSFNPEAIQALSRVDPSGDKGQYLEWLIRQSIYGYLPDPEDSSRIKNTLSTYHNLKLRPKLLQQYGVSADINHYTFKDLEKIENRIKGENLRTESGRAGFERIYDDGQYTVIQIGGPGVDRDLAIEAACFFAEGTSWCTREEHHIKKYLSEGPLYILFHHGRKVLQTDGNEINDAENDPFEPTPENLPYYEILMELGIVKRSTYYYLVATEIVGDRVPEGEKYIQEDPNMAYKYASNVINGPWPPGEPAIATDPQASYRYTLYVLNKNHSRIGEMKRWPPGEPAMRRDPRIWDMYLQRCGFAS